MDFTKGAGISTTEVYFIANDVEGLPRGSYFFNRISKSLDLLKKDVQQGIVDLLVFKGELDKALKDTDEKKIEETEGFRSVRAADSSPK